MAKASQTYMKIAWGGSKEKSSSSKSSSTKSSSTKSSGSKCNGACPKHCRNK